MIENKFGKKVFFLYPHSVIKSDLIHEFITNEYEVYTLKDHNKVKLILSKYPNSILFINIDENLKEEEWIEYVKSINENPDYQSTQIGILTYNENQDLLEKYLMELNVTCGFIQLKLGRIESKHIILKTLDANECKGKRKYIRATSTNRTKSTFNVKVGQEVYTGIINDISSAGMSCIFNEKIELKKNAFLRQMQLKINGKLLLADAIVFGSRIVSKKETLVVLMFTNSLSDHAKSKIHQYIGEVIQSDLDKEIKNIYG